jgi:hypothetical protein
VKIASFAALGVFIVTAPAFADQPFASEFDAKKRGLVCSQQKQRELPLALPGVANKRTRKNASLVD